VALASWSAEVEAVGRIASCGPRQEDGLPAPRHRAYVPGRRWRAPDLVRQAARSLRKNPTEAESALWRYLHQRRLAGLRFRRQHPIGVFVVDFYCPSLRLAIELDGAVHDGAEPARTDAARERALTGHGVTVLRFTNDQVLNEPHRVLAAIAAKSRGLAAEQAPDAPF
jgi:very-short-patch-repair endonuclease